MSAQPKSRRNVIGLTDSNLENGIPLDEMALDEITGESMGDLEWFGQEDEVKENDDSANIKELPSNLKKPALFRNESKSTKMFTGSSTRLSPVPQSLKKILAASSASTKRRPQSASVKRGQRKDGRGSVWVGQPNKTVSSRRRPASSSGSRRGKHTIIRKMPRRVEEGQRWKRPFDTSLPHVTSQRKVESSRTYIAGENAARKERRRPRVSRLAATGGAGRTTKEKLHIIGCVYDRDNILQKRTMRKKKIRPRSAGVVRAQHHNTRGTTAVLAVKKKKKGQRKKKIKRNGHDNSTSRRANKTRPAARLGEKETKTKASDLYVTEEKEELEFEDAAAERRLRDESAEENEDENEDKETVLGGLKRTDIDLRLQELRQKMKSFDNEDDPFLDGDKVSLMDELDENVTYDDDFEGLPIAAINDENQQQMGKVEEIEDSPFRIDGLAEIDPLVDLIATKYGGMETKDIHDGDEVPLLPKETANVLGLSPRETEFLAGVIHKDIGMRAEEPKLPTHFAEKLEVDYLDAHKVETSEQVDAAVVCEFSPLSSSYAVVLD